MIPKKERAKVRSVILSGQSGRGFKILGQSGRNAMLPAKPGDAQEAARSNHEASRDRGGLPFKILIKTA